MSGYMDGAVFSRMFASGTAAIANAMQEVNELNVFPVPDGDTGTNMSMTMDAGLKGLNGGHTHAGQAAGAAAQGLLRGARGNSGVILSLLFRGFAKSIKEREHVDGPAFASAMADGVDTAYRAVMKPAEGTVLTVSRMSSRSAVVFAEHESDLERVMAYMLEQAEAALKETVNQNEVLAKAGVVDAGAYGFCLILKGMLEALRGAPVKRESSEQVSGTSANFSEFSNEDILFGYCTEFIVKRPRNDKHDPARLRAFLESSGDSLVFVEDEQIIKVHIHTDNPGRVLAQALINGELTAIKVENMREQHTEQVVRQENAQAEPVPEPEQHSEPARPIGFVSVCAGEGLSAVLRDLGVDQLVEGGQTMNPSTQDILDKVKLVNAQTVFVLPNNKNIIMAAQQCVPLSDKQVVVLPSKSVPQGIMAMLSYDASLDVEANKYAMTAALETVVTMQVTYAARDSQFDGLDISAGDYMALIDGKLACNSPSRDKVLKTLADTAAQNNPENITIYYGEDASESDAGEAARIFEESCPGAAVMSLAGGQPVYSFVIAIE